MKKKRRGVWYSIKNFTVNNLALMIFTIIALAVVVSYTLTSHLPEIYPGIGKWYKLANDLSLGILINFVFYVFQVYIPQRKREEKSLLALKPELIKLVKDIQEFDLVINEFLPTFRTGRFNVSENIVYYLIQNDKNVRKGWARKFDLFGDFSIIKKSVDKSLVKLMDSVFLSQCDGELIGIIGKLNINQFLSSFVSAETEKFNPSFSFDGLEKSYREFVDTFDQLKSYVGEGHIRYISALSRDEINTFNSAVADVAETCGKTIMHLGMDLSKK